MVVGKQIISMLQLPEMYLGSFAKRDEMLGLVPRVKVGQLTSVFFLIVFKSSIR